VVLGDGHARLAPSLVHTADGGEAQVEADYTIDQDALDLAISTEKMKVASLRAQVSLAAVPWLDQLWSGQWSGNLLYHHEPGKAGWSGDLQVDHAELAVPGLTSPVELAAAHATIDGPRVAIDHLRARAGRLAFTGDYRYEPDSPHPHRLRLRAAQWDAADVEAECLPMLRRPGSLLARALGRTSLPEWLKTRAVEGVVQIDGLTLAGAPLENVRARLSWNAARVELQNLQARFERATFSGRLAVSLRGPRPAYTLDGRLAGLDWQAGRLDAEGTLATFGTGGQLLGNLTSEGTFAGAGLDFGSPVTFRTATGAYTLAFSQGIPRLKLTALRLRTEDESFTGRGSTQDDGRLAIVLTDGTREVRMSGPPGKLKVEEAVR